MPIRKGRKFSFPATKGTVPLATNRSQQPFPVEWESVCTEEEALDALLQAFELIFADEDIFSSASQLDDIAPSEP